MLSVLLSAGIIFSLAALAQSKQQIRIGGSAAGGLLSS
jgi:hypothetical protein